MNILDHIINKIITSNALEFLLQIVALLPLIYLFFNMFNYDEIDNITMNRPKQRYNGAVKYLQLLSVLFFINLLFFLANKSESITFIFYKNSSILNTLVSTIIAFSACILINTILIIFKIQILTDIKNIIFYYTVSFFSRFIIILINSLITQRLIVGSTIYKLVIFFIFTLLMYSKIFYNKDKNNYRSYEEFNQLINTDNFLALVISAYLILTFYIHNLSNFSSMEIIYLISFSSFLVLIFKFYLNYINQRIYYFYSTEYLNKIYNIDTIINNKVKMYIHYTTNEKYYVCSLNKVINPQSKRYLIDYDEVNKCGGFLNEKVK